MMELLCCSFQQVGCYPEDLQACRQGMMTPFTLLLSLLHPCRSCCRWSASSRSRKALREQGGAQAEAVGGAGAAQGAAAVVADSAAAAGVVLAAAGAAGALEGAAGAAAARSEAAGDAGATERLLLYLHPTLTPCALSPLLLPWASFRPPSLCFPLTCLFHEQDHKLRSLHHGPTWLLAPAPLTR